MILNVRLKDQAFEQIIAPPQANAGLAQTANAAVQTSNLISFQNTLFGSEVGLTQAFQSYQSARITVYRDIGTLPYDEWEAFSEIFPAGYQGAQSWPRQQASQELPPLAPAQPPQGANR